MQKVIKKIKLNDESNSSLSFWNAKTESEKLSAVQELREQYIILFHKEDQYNESRKRLRRFYKVIKRTQS